MKEENLENLLNELAESTAEQVRPGLAEDIKQQIPHRLAAHRRGMDTVNIIIDLRISKLAAAAAIIIVMLLLASFFGGRDSTGGIYQESKLLVRYLLGTGKNSALTVKLTYEHLVEQGIDVVYYGDSIDRQDSNAVLMQWKVSEGRYKVLFRDLREQEVSAEELIELQARMLQKKTE
ncbi:MAG: hypothetical protein ACYSWR_03630 [Planctomycetota bacterium]|jgi:hypothetical protein